jgi:hypothetical protein
MHRIPRHTLSLQSGLLESSTSDNFYRACTNNSLDNCTSVLYSYIVYCWWWWPGGYIYKHKRSVWNANVTTEHPLPSCSEIRSRSRSHPIPSDKTDTEIERALAILHIITACSFDWWLMIDADLFWEKSTAGWLLVAGFLWEKSTAGWWLIRQANRGIVCRADLGPTGQALAIFTKAFLFGWPCNGRQDVSISLS